MPAQHETSPGSAPGERGSLARILPVLLASALLAACSKSPDTGDAPDAAPAQAGAAEAPQQVAEPPASSEPTIRRASRALAEKRLFEPAHDNALALYLKVLDESAETAESGEDGRLRRLSDSVGADTRMLAQQTLLDLFPFGVIWVEGAIREERFSDADRVIALLDRAQPEAASVQNLRDTLQTARTNLERARENERLAQIQAASKPPAGERAVSTAAATAMPDVAASGTTPGGSPSSSTATGMATASPTAAQTPPAEQPAGLAVVHEKETISAPVVAASSEADLVLERSVTPRYPSRAKRQRIEGWVEVRFTVLADGSVTDPVVTQSEPSGVFDRDAVEAVRRWKYEPVSGPTPATRRIEFRLNG